MPNENAVLMIAHISRDSVAMNEAALAGDFDEARFRAQLIRRKAESARLDHVMRAAARVSDRLGPIGSVPRSGYGGAMLAVATALDDAGFEPL